MKPFFSIWPDSLCEGWRNQCVGSVAYIKENDPLGALQAKTSKNLQAE